MLIKIRRQQGMELGARSVVEEMTMEISGDGSSIFGKVFVLRPWY
jgi:hypothetical protein